MSVTSSTRLYLFCDTIVTNNCKMYQKLREERKNCTCLLHRTFSGFIFVGTFVGYIPLVNIKQGSIWPYVIGFPSSLFLFCSQLYCLFWLVALNHSGHFKTAYRHAHIWYDINNISIKFAREGTSFDCKVNFYNHFLKY